MAWPCNILGFSGAASGGLDEGFAQCDEQAGKGHGPSIPGPALPVHADMEMTTGKGNPNQQDLEVLVAGIILHRNSQVCFHKSMVAAGVGKISRARNRARAVVY